MVGQLLTAAAARICSPPSLGAAQRQWQPAWWPPGFPSCIRAGAGACLNRQVNGAPPSSSPAAGEGSVAVDDVEARGKPTSLFAFPNERW